MPPEPRRFPWAPTFGSLVGLGVVAVIVCSGVLLYFRYAQQGREAARRDRCANHLKQIGFALHRYSADHEALPPSVVAADQPTWAFFLWPYLEALPQTDASDTRIDVFARYDFNQDCFAGPNAKELGGALWIGWFCPARRAGTKTVAVESLVAQPSDYACVGSTNRQDPLGPEANSVLMAAELPKGKLTFATIRSRTTFADVTDGLSVTAVIGEKHIVGTGLWSPALDRFGGDGPVMLGREIYFLRQMGEYAGGSLAQGPSDDRADNLFGSWHPRICQFLMCDASVQAKSNATDEQVLTLLGGRNDRESVASQASGRRSPPDSTERRRTNALRRDIGRLTPAARREKKPTARSGLRAAGGVP